MKTIRLFEAFAGIGSQYKALKNIANDMNWNIKPCGIIEWYIDAIIGYMNIHYSNMDFNINKEIDKTKIRVSKNSKTLTDINKIKDNSYIYIYNSFEIANNKFDITKINGNDIPKNIDIFTYSFPCQDLSVQGKQKGMEKTSKTRSGLLWELERIFNEIDDLPKYLLLENVYNITSKKHINSYNDWLKYLDSIGYESYTYKLNAVDFSIPQNRKRVFCLSVRKDFKNKVNFEFTKDLALKNQNPKLKDILDNNSNHKYLLNLDNYQRTNFNKTNSKIISSKLINFTNFNSENYVYNIEGCGPTLTASGANSRIKILDPKNNKIRYLTPKECFRYMGFDDIDYQNLNKNNMLSETKQIFLAGNSIVVKVLEAIFRSLKF